MPIQVEQGNDLKDTWQRKRSITFTNPDVCSLSSKCNQMFVINFALFKALVLRSNPSQQSSTKDGRNASLALDGLPGEPHCSQTSKIRWWLKSNI